MGATDKVFAYYMPLHLTQIAQGTEDPQLTEFCELFKIVNTNACVIDRTGTISTPFTTVNLFPIPEQTANVKDFGTLCIERAQELVAKDKPIMFLYSGGLDSTSMLVAFDRVLSETKNWDQLVICTSQDAIPENPWAWNQVILPKYKLAQARDVLSAVDLHSNVYVQGENADQLFGSDRVLTEPELLTMPFDSDVLKTFLASRVSSENLDRWHTVFMTLAAKCPLPMPWLRDFLWWVNFTCKWQSVAMRTLCFTNVFVKDAKVPLADLHAFDTFFNTVGFQQLSLSGKLNRWGSKPSPYTYKAAARHFIATQTGWKEYATSKLKMGSLYNVIRQLDYPSDSLLFDKATNTVCASRLQETLL